jgi:Bacterial membrane protein YfhO
VHPRAHQLHRLAPYVSLALFTIVFLWPLCIGRTLYWGDIMLYFEPMQRYAQQELQAGRLPLWNPYILCGQPFIGNPQMSVFYPPSLLLLPFPTWMALNITTILHVFLCGAFMFLFLRRWTVNLLPAFSGALVYMGSAYLLGRLQFPPMIQTAAYFPLLFAVLDLNLDAPSVRNLVTLAVTVALTIMAAHSQVAYLSFGSATGYTLMRLWRRRSVLQSLSAPSNRLRRGRRARALLAETIPVLGRAAPLVGAATMGLVLAAIYLLPAIQLLHESPREQMSVGQANRFFVDFPHILAVIFPRFTGHPASRDFWARGNAWEPAWFVGWVPLGLAAYASLRCRRENLVRFWLTLGTAGAWLALGSVGGLYWLAFYVVPGLANFHDPARFLLWTTVAAAVLTAVGLDALQIRLRWRSNRPMLLIVGAVAVPLVLFAGDWIPTTSPETVNRVPTELPVIRPAVGDGRVAIPANTLFWKRVVTDGYIDYGSPDARSVQRAIDTLLSNLDMRNGLESASGYEPVPIGGHVAIEGLFRLAQQRREPNAARLAALLDVRLLLMPATGGAPASGFRAMTAGSRLSGTPLKLWVTNDFLGRSWMTRRIRRVEGRTRIAAALTAPDFYPSQSTIVSGISEDALDGLSQSRRYPTTTPLKWVEWRRVSPYRIDLRADAGLESAFLVYSGTAYPGWKATVEGSQVPVTCADGALLGVVLPPGKHDVVIYYSPDVFRVGAYLSLVASATYVALITSGLAVRGNLSARRGT